MACARKLGKCRSSEGLHSKRNKLHTSYHFGCGYRAESRPQVQVPSLQKHCKAATKVVECKDCKDHFHASCANLENDELEKLESGIETWYCSNCKAECGLCSGAVLVCHKTVQCDKCDMWIYNESSYITESQNEIIQNSNCTWICPKCDFFNFSDSFFDEQLNLVDENRFNLLAKGDETKSPSAWTIKTVSSVG